jgi:hypothetical protein
MLLLQFISQDFKNAVNTIRFMDFAHHLSIPTKKNCSVWKAVTMNICINIILIKQNIKCKVVLWMLIGL